MQLYIVRHGIAIDREDPKCPPDPERYLTEEGLEKTKQVAKGVAALGVTGGGIYDALLGHCALKAKAEIIYTWNVKHFKRLGPEIAGRVTTP